METRKKNFCENRNASGALTFLEGERDVPFPIRRVYYIYDVLPGGRRGFHAHKNLEQYLICVSGSCKILLEDASGRQTVALERPREGLYIAPHVWHEMYDFAPGTVLLALASDYYDENDYIRQYEEFCRCMKEVWTK